MDNRIYLNKTIDVKIDRPLGSKHPKHSFIYTVNYGYVPNTISGDGEELDCYVLGIYEPLDSFKGKCIAIIHRLEEDDDKLIVVPENKSFSDSEIRALTDFQEQYFKSEIIRSPNYLQFNKNIPNAIKYIEHTPSSDEFNYLTNSVGWGIRKNNIIEEALKNTLYSLCVYDNDKLIGYGRIIGDKTMFLYIQDIMVIPEYQNKHIGTAIMNNLLKQIKNYKKINPNIRTYLGATKGKEAFYEKFGFVSRPNEELGAGMILY